MKKIIIMAMFVTLTGSVFAADVFMNNNPFPQTMPQTMNNIYESEPATIQQEAKQEKRFWFRKGKNLQEQDKIEQSQNNLNTFPKKEGAGDGSFYLFK